MLLEPLNLEPSSHFHTSRRIVAPVKTQVVTAAPNFPISRDFPWKMGRGREQFEGWTSSIHNPKPSGGWSLTGVPLSPTLAG